LKVNDGARLFYVDDNLPNGVLLLQGFEGGDCWGEGVCSGDDGFDGVGGGEGGEFGDGGVGERGLAADYERTILDVNNE
jgi:hypothetical protein